MKFERYTYVALLFVTCVVTSVIAVVDKISRRNKDQSFQKVKKDELTQEHVPQFGVALVIGIMALINEIFLLLDLNLLLPFIMSRIFNTLNPGIVPIFVLIFSKRHRQRLFSCCGCDNAADYDEIKDDEEQIPLKEDRRGNHFAG